MAWTADELYGRDGAFLDGLDERGEAFVVEIPPHAHVLKLRYSGESLRYDPEFRGLSGGEHALEFGDAAGRF